MTRTQTAPDPLVGLDQAIELLGTTRPTLYRWLRTGQVKAIKVGRQWRFRPDDLASAMRGEAPRIELPVRIDALLAALAREVEAVSPGAPPVELSPTGSGARPRPSPLSS